MWRGKCDRTQKVIKSLLLSWLVGISLIAHLVECGPPEWGGVGSSPLETWSCDIGAPNENIFWNIFIVKTWGIFTVNAGIVDRIF